MVRGSGPREQVSTRYDRRDRKFYRTQRARRTYRRWVAFAEALRVEMQQLIRDIQQREWAILLRDGR